MNKSGIWGIALTLLGTLGGTVSIVSSARPHNQFLLNLLGLFCSIGVIAFGFYFLFGPIGGSHR